ncbi:hypothetical protein BDZ94DRAFT_1277369 [Collybia nuda]|uniref:Uncharacterized protein n=1 Tax=Collybia nuda TaxID=64659 RepID=A0A9P6C8A9_9AGAR|nr:hypothetical protein BDZ94DRAFT_1277427 [Collybia nuda]KAF9455767.1 hypothetical protein BDZ94DRAFT_1277369 [Collybia nuda]
MILAESPRSIPNKRVHDHNCDHFKDLVMSKIDQRLLPIPLLAKNISQSVLVSKMIGYGFSSWRLRKPSGSHMPRVSNRSAPTTRVQAFQLSKQVKLISELSPSPLPTLGAVSSSTNDNWSCAERTIPSGFAYQALQGHSHDRCWPRAGFSLHRFMS